MSRSRMLLPVGLILLVSLAASLASAGDVQRRPQQSITDRSVQWPTWHQWKRVLLLQDYNTRVVLLGTTLLGFAAGAVGSFALLRKRALMGDALSHATLPGIGLAFVGATLAGADGRSLPLILAGATASGLVGLAAILVLRNATRIKEDSALAIVLSVFFGAGLAVLGVAQQMEAGHAAGLEAFIYGKAASLGPRDAQLIGTAASAVALTCLFFFKELKLLCFDEPFAASRGYPVVLLDLILMGLIVAVTIVGLHSVGLILMIALLVIPACAARFWTERMSVMSLLAVAFGGFSSLLGAGASAVLPRLPSGAMIVVVATLLFVFSMVVAPGRGLLARVVRRRRLEAKVRRQHLLRAIYECLEGKGSAPLADQLQPAAPVRVAELVRLRSWSKYELRGSLRRARAAGLLQLGRDNAVRLTARGAQEAASCVHDHRLWELYLIHYADVAPSRVDRGADSIEHVLDAGMVAELEELLQQQLDKEAMPPSPHALSAGLPSSQA